MRRLLLWSAQNRWLATHVPRWRFAQRAVRRFLPGEGFESALKAAVDFRKHNIGALFTLLGENVTDLTDANQVVEHYEEVLAGSRALQAYLYRTVSDIAGLLPLKPAIRLVKGAYAEPQEIAFTAKRDVDANYLALSVFMLPELKRRNLRLVLATHDVDLVAKIWRFGQALEMDRSELEVAMLYGIRTDEQLRLAREGFTVRDLIAYGGAWYGWYLRRLAERPANVWFVARQLLP